MRFVRLCWSLMLFVAGVAAAERPDLPVPPPWCDAIGRDRYGIWAELTIGTATQRLRLIPAGTFRMGNPDYDPELWEGWDSGFAYNEAPHEVTLTQSFWLGDSEMTQAFWQAVMTTNPSNGVIGPQQPVNSVSWSDCQAFCHRLNQRVKNLHACLPTEAQWEYACRAGTTGDFAGPITTMANVKDPSHDCAIAPVRSYQPNAWGLFDMHGNVWEWCSDWAGDYPHGAQRDPRGPASGTIRILRSGSRGLGYGEFPFHSSTRFGASPDEKLETTGFRLLLSATP